MKMLDFILEPEFLASTIYYQYGENIFTYIIGPVYQDFSFGYDIEDPIVDEYIKTVDDIEIQVTEYIIVESKQKEFSAEFEYKDVTYILTGIIEKTNLKNFGKSPLFLKKAKDFGSSCVYIVEEQKYEKKKSVIKGSGNDDSGAVSIRSIRANGQRSRGEC